MSMKIAITGKPDIGKSTVIKIIECEFPKKVVAGGDAFEAIDKSVFPEIKTDTNQKSLQKVLYALQYELENILVQNHPNQLLLCDHGSLDLIALWPGSTESFFSELQTSLEKELLRYDYVIQINGPESILSPSSFKPKHNPSLFWQQHPRFLEIPAQRGFSFSYSQITHIIKSILSEKPFNEIQNSLVQAIKQIGQSGFLNRNELGRDLTSNN